jgi:nucleoside-diphosphate-sugar epimerase
MRVLVTGAGGYIGRALVARLLDDSGARELEMVLLDRRLDDLPGGPNIERLEGDLGDRDLIRRSVDRGVDRVFHLASVPGGAAEEDFERGLHVNLEATLWLLEALRATQRKPRYVFASTVAVYGVPMPDYIDEATPAAPSLSYGAQKLAAEILAADYGRKGYVDAVSLRLPGIVARPAQAGGMRSAFMSELLREIAAGRPYTCPVAASGVAWWMSRACAVENLLQAARLSEAQLGPRRSFVLPALRATMAEVVAAVGRVRRVDAARLVDYRDDANLRAQFASLPPLDTPAALAAGFHHDGDCDTLVRRALED